MMLGRALKRRGAAAGRLRSSTTACALKTNYDEAAYRQLQAELKK